MASLRAQMGRHEPTLAVWLASAILIIAVVPGIWAKALAVLATLVLLVLASALASSLGGLWVASILIACIIPIAVLSYQNYSVQSELARELSRVSHVRAVVEKNYESNPASKSLGQGWNPPNLGDGLKAVSIDSATGQVHLQFAIDLPFWGPEEIVSVTITPTLAPGQPATWHCRGEPRNYMPGPCRGNQ